MKKVKIYIAIFAICSFCQPVFAEHRPIFLHAPSISEKKILNEILLQDGHIDFLCNPEALRGNLGERSGAKFVPGGLNVQFTKDALLKDEFDEWLARLICYAFSVPPVIA